jgi:hypothetical protein
MNHPKPEDWVPFLFGESKPEDRRQLNQHLQNCAECRHQLSSWERNLGRLDAWKVRPARRTVPAFQPFLRWAAAAAVLAILALGFLFGRMSSSGPDAQTLQAAIEPRLRQQLRVEFIQLVRQEMAQSASVTLAAAQRQTQQLVAAYDQSLSANRANEVQNLYAALDKLAAQHVTDFLSLKKDVDTVAVFTDAGLRRTEQQLVQFADFARPAGPSGLQSK